MLVTVAILGVLLVGALGASAVVGYLAYGYGQKEGQTQGYAVGVQDGQGYVNQNLLKQCQATPEKVLKISCGEVGKEETAEEKRARLLKQDKAMHEATAKEKAKDAV